MARVCFVLVAGLDQAAMKAGEGLGLEVLNAFPHGATYEPVFPAVTCTMQATLSTGAMPGEHGILCNGVYTHGRPELRPHLDLTNHSASRLNVSFWEQANSLVQRPRFWDGLGRKVAMLFWQNSMPSLAGEKAAADVVLTPKPVHTKDGKTMTACWSQPADLYSRLANELGPFPLHKYWSPMAGIESSDWIVKAAERVWRREKPDLQLVYIPHLDYSLQRVGPGGEIVGREVAEVDRLLKPLADRVRADGGILIVAGDYGMQQVSQCALPNLALRDAGLLATAADEGGKLLVDYAASAAFALCDHQVAYVYVREKGDEQRAAAVRVLEQLAGVGKILQTAEEIAQAGLANPRCGDLVLIAAPNAWFAHDWWHSDEEKPSWQFTVDIHNKPGYDPRELFFDPARKCIAQEAALVKGSHGVIGDSARWPLLMSDRPLPQQPIRAGGVGAGVIAAGDIASWLRGMVES